MPRRRLACCCSRTATRPAGCKWLKAAAEQGEPRALLVYGTALFNGDGVAQDPVLGYAYVSRAAAQGLAPAKETLRSSTQLMPLGPAQKGVALALAEGEAAPASAERRSRRRPRRKAAPAQPKPRRSRRRASPLRRAAASRRRGSGAWRIQLGAFSQRGVGRSAVPQALGQGALAGRSAVLYARRRGHPASGRAVRKRRRPHAACSALGAGLLPGRAK